MSQKNVKSVKIEGFHGTSKENGTKIVEKGFIVSKGDSDWLGDGVYFFTEGIPPKPLNNAVKWGIASAWDKQLKRNKYSEYAVIKGNTEVEESKFLDLTENNGIKLFNYLRNKYINSIVISGQKLKGKHSFKDGHIINEARNALGIDIDVVKGHFYIKFQKERIYDINFRTPNTTILAVYNDKLIIQKSLVIVKTNKF